MQDLFAVTKHAEQAASPSASVGRFLIITIAVGGVETMFDEVEGGGVTTGRNGDGVGKVSPSFSLVHLRIVSIDGRFVGGTQLTAFEIVVRSPPHAVVGVVGNIAGRDAHRPLPSPQARQNLD